MKTWLRRLRGALGIGTLWGGAGMALGTIAGLVVGLATDFPLLSTVLSLAVNAGVVGFGLGTAFAVVLTTLERKRTADQLTPARAAGWGAIAGAGLILVVGSVVFPRLLLGFSSQAILVLLASATASYGVLAAGLAAGTVALARKAPSELDTPDDFTPLPSSHGS